MYYMNLSNQLSFLTIACFSFFIMLFTFSLNKGKSLFKLSGIAFFMPFVLACASFISAKPSHSGSLLLSAQLIILLSLFMLLVFKPKNKYLNPIFIIFLVLPFIIIYLIYYVNVFNKYLVLTQVHVPIFITLTSLTAYVLRKQKGFKSLIFWGMLSLLSASVVEIVGTSNGLDIISSSFQLLAYILFLLYFFKETYSTLMKAIVEAEKKTALMNKSLDLEVKKRVFEIELSNEKLLNISKTDSLTKAFNKAGVLDKMDNLILKKSSMFSILMFDIDFFKTINDTHGHIEGDKCLRKLALIAQKSIRDVDCIGRYGGDEFIIVLPGASASHASVIAERFRKNVAETESPHFTVSIGIASYPQDGLTVKELIGSADEGLYASKKKGRNAVSHKNLF